MFFELKFKEGILFPAMCISAFVESFHAGYFQCYSILTLNITSSVSTGHINVICPLVPPSAAILFFIFRFICLQGNSVHRRMTIRRRDSIVGVPRRLSSKEVRGKIVEEILNTEKDYVNHLEDIIEVGGG